ncbi:MAG TPA: HAD family phosphatase [Caulobacteraceae bacterium]
MNLPRTVRAVVFDMDGLLVDTETVSREAMTLAARGMGYELPHDVFIKQVGISFAASGAILAEHFGPAFDVAGFQAESTRRFRAQGELGVALKAGVVELLDFLDSISLPRAIATSSPHQDVERHLGRHGLRERFDTVVAGGDYTRSKPFPDPFLTAAERLGVEPGHCLALEDSHNGVRAAHAAGMMAVMVPDLLEPTQEMHELCVRIIESLHEVRGLIAASEEIA